MDSPMVLEQLYADCTGQSPESVAELPTSGSHRRYFRLTGSVDLVGVIGTSLQENEAFLYLDEHFGHKGLPVPRVLAVSDDRMAYLQEDLGNLSLFDALSTGRTDGAFLDEEKELLIKTISRLPDFQIKGAEGLDFSHCHPPVPFDSRSIMWDLNYFKYCFLKATGLDFLEDRLEDDFQALIQTLTLYPSDTFMYRDFQSRNVMVRDREPWFIDFQGGRKGPVYYDVASFLWQAKACYPPGLRDELIREYVKALRKYQPVNEDRFRAALRHFVLFRTLQVLGTYGFRGYFEKKKHFLESVPYAIQNLRELLKEPFIEYPYLSLLLRQLVDMKQFAAKPEKKPLTIRVLSFSYRKGIPEDASGNGGGFVFDCRGIHNPGRYDQYKPFTGLDSSVIKFLEDDGEVVSFMEHCSELVDATVERYIARGFDSLMVCFGCTGGQHRSVYCAQHMAEHLIQTHNVIVELEHREQGIIRTIRPTN